MKRIFGFILFIGVSVGGSAQNMLTLDSCRAMALKNNKELRISAEKINVAHYEKKAAFTNYLPKIAAMGTYMRTQKEISLLSNDQKGALSNIGTVAQGSLQETFQQLAASSPELGALLQPLAPLIPGIGSKLNGVGQGLVDALHTDTRNMYAGAVTLTQPIFMGGKIVAYNKITQYAEQLAKSQHATGMQDIILSTDQAYWQVISLINKKKLAESYLKLVQQLDGDVDKMITEGVATKADGLSVKVKVNEAEMKLTQVEDGLSLSKMVLCQLCGIPLDEEIRLADENVENLLVADEIQVADNVATALANREELRSLDLATKIYAQKVNVTRADFLPTVALTANYMVTNPSLVNGFENKFRGMWAVGALVKIPIWNWGEGMYKVKAAKAEANIARYQLSDVKEKVELQVNQATFKVNEAGKKLAMATKNMEKAEENLRYAKLGFSEGVIPTSNVLEAQTAWLSAQSDKIDAQIDVKLTQVYLRKSMGTLK
ncbi:TolC family protein [uncultured Phocaeicola sp.]|jgi:outer membrane protein TolC|uniref:TolC family protein n=1 Tax=uncultured Phocaeicola sp. TaxID=990718 RepID=UPI002588682B|nr:TolC family protein [uncultured Phocaeicola sp.]